MGGEHVNVRMVVCEFYQRTGNFSVGTREYTAMQDTCNTLEGHFSARNPTKLGVTNHTNEASTGFCRASFFFFLSLPRRAAAAGLVSVQQLIRKAVSAGLGLFTGSRHKETLANVTHKYVLNVWQSVEIVTVSHEYQTNK